MRLAFAGTPDVAVVSLRALLSAGRHEVAAVITRPPAAAGRGRREAASPVQHVAAEAGIPVLTPARASDPDFLAELRALEVDCCPVVAFGALLPKAALEIPRHGWVNLHFSLLPAWRGAAPVQHAILHGDEVTGASTFLIEEGLDTGPVFGVVTEAIRPADTSGDLLARLAESGAGLLVATLDGIADGVLVPQPQPSDGVSIAGKITTADAQIGWDKPARHIDRQVRACTPSPGAWTTFRGARLKLGPVRMSESLTAGSPSGSLRAGEIRVSRTSVAAGTASTEVELSTVQPQGGRAMPAADWARGVRPEPGERFSA